MSKSYRSINIFVSHPFVPDNSAWDLEKFRTNIQLLVSQAENEVRKEYSDFEIDTIFEFSDFQNGLPKQIEQSIKKSHFAIVDITENRPNIFFEYGLMCALNVPALLIKTTSSFSKFDLPADIKDRIAVSYKDFDELKTKCLDNVVLLFKQLLNSDSLYNIYLNKIWFPINTSLIHVIAPPEPEKPEFASPESKNYIFLNNLGDIDTVLDVMNFLHRNFRNIQIPIYAADEFKNHIEDNLVVIGGPGEDGDGNNVCAMIMDKIDTKVSYLLSDDSEKMLCKGREYEAVERGGRIVKDYGYFARFPNPFNPNTSVILIHGIHTFGVLGAAKAFSDHPSAQGNIKKLLKKLNIDEVKQASFECFFPVDVLQQSVVCPEVDEDNILPLLRKK